MKQIAEKGKSLSPREWIMIAVIIILVVGIILRRNYFMQHVGTFFGHGPKVENQMPNVDKPTP